MKKECGTTQFQEWKGCYRIVASTTKGHKMKQYLKGIRREFILQLKYYPKMSVLFGVLCLVEGLWSGIAIEKGEQPFYQMVALLVLLLVLMFVADVQIKKIRNKGVL